MDFSLNDLSLVILPGNPPPGFAQIGLYNDAYRHYKSVWERTFTLRAGAGSYDAYAFFRQDLIYLFMYRGQIAGQICSSYLSLNSEILTDLAYFDNFRGAALETMLARGLKTVVSLEYSSIARPFSPRMLGGFHLNELITRMSVVGGAYFGAEGMLALPRRVTGTNDVVDKLKFEKIAESKSRMGISVDVFIGNRENMPAYEDAAVEFAFQTIWSKRTDLVSNHDRKSQSTYQTIHQRSDNHEEQYQGTL